MILDKNTTLFVSMVTGIYTFFIAEEDRVLGTNAICEEIQISKGIYITFDLNHVSHTAHRMVLTKSDATHQNISSKYVEGISDYSKLMFDQGGFGKMSDSIVWNTDIFEYTGELKVMSSAIFAENVKSDILIEMIAKKPPSIKKNKNKKNGKRKT
jgi:hypothetical protein